jgi:hypothetical protein
MYTPESNMIIDSPWIANKVRKLVAVQLAGESNTMERIKRKNQSLFFILTIFCPSLLISSSLQTEPLLESCSQSMGNILSGH